MSQERRPKGWLTSRKQVEDWLDIAEFRITQQDYNGAFQTAKRVLKYVPKDAAVCAKAYGLMGMAYAMQKDFENSYQYLSQALTINPRDVLLWYNRSLSALYTTRTGQALRDLEQADRLGGEASLVARIRVSLKDAREFARKDMALRGMGFTLNQLIEQQEIFHQGLAFASRGEWQSAEACFRRSIEMGDCLPQPWGNLGICCLMQNRFDEAEMAFKKALAHDPNYELAKQNLGKIPDLRAHPEIKPQFVIQQGTQNAKVGLSVIKQK